ncbi:MAG: vesicle coat component [Thelocarpon impressellum]|nr:MAG: vesicle coat component [Thelocarpon impressellum]
MTSTDPFGDVADTEDDVFASLANGTTESPQHEPHSLQRKSTSQVLGSLNMPAHHDTSGGIAVSTATVISQVLGDASTVREPEEKKKVEQRDDEPEDRDLAELWKAALDDDEFLDDEEPITDPTGLFPDDGEGFLEDFDDQAPKEGLQSLSPSIPAAVLDGDGKMLGFNGLSTTHLGREPSQVLSQNSHAPLSAPYSQPQFGSNAQPAAQFTNQRADASRGQQSPYPTFAGAQQTPQVWNPMQANSSLKPEVSRAQSYADKSKGGYSSPYDLPMDVTRPKKRASMQHMARGFNRQLSRYAPGRVSATPPPPRGALSLIASPPKRTTSAYQPGAGPPATEASFAPPRRSQTQSPGALAGLGFPLAPQEPHLRPASANNPASPPTTTNAYAPGNAIATGALPPAVSRSINYIVPNDGREADPFQRWKGCPIFSWGFGGTVVTTFPKEVQRYSSGQVLPLVKSSPGEVKTLSIKDFTPLEQHLSTFPGPLRSKGKKKEVVSWLEKLIEIRKSHSHIFPEGSSDGKIDEEKTLLCQVLRTLVEGDGVLDGTPEVQQAVRKLLSPGLQDDSGDLTSAYLVGGGHGGITQSATSRVHADAVDPGAVEQLRKALLAGDRESAVWQAVDKRLWAHAMLISSTLSRAVWKQVVQEFVRQEVKNIGENTESLSALYEVFAGNHEESIDELVPPSARAGFQLVSKTAEGGPTKDALQGLDKWRETLGLILSNRSTDDGQAIVALGRLLSGYGRVEAAHTCYMFARSYSYFGGVDDPQTSIALVGVNHLQRPFDYSRDLEAILLSEVYEFGLSLASSIPVNAVVPHLQAYKLHYAMVLADHGLRSNAQQYCEAIYGCIKSTTKPSPYYNGVLLTLLDDFTKRLQQSPKDGSTSWISKPTMGKISGSLVTKFNSFVVGDDSDAASAGSGKEGSVDVGPFAKVAGGTPTISRSPSNTDLYGSYGSGESYPSVGGRGPSPGDPARTSRYAPASVQAPRNGQDQPRSSLDANRSATDFQRGSLDSPRPAGHPSPLALSDGYVSSYAQGSDVPSSGQLPREGFAQSQQERYAPSQAASASIISPYRQGGSPYGPASHQPTPPPEAAAGYGVHESPAASDPRPQQARAQYEQQPSPYEPPGQEPAAVGYEPPSYAAPSYEPPSYEPYDADQQNGDLSPMDAKPKKKTFMDDDDDDFPKAPAKPPNQDKAAKDREAEENFRKAAEDDATKDKQSGDKKGWFGGWFGKKDPNAAPGPIRAKLGEESSFHYDPVLKKWINKKGGDTQSTASSGTPPPPRGGPPSRAVSGGPPTSLALSSTSVSRPPMSASTPNMHAPTSSPGLSSPLPQPSRSPSGAGTPPIPEYREPSTIAASLAPPGSGNASGPPSRPPSRPSTSMSTASSIDDLLGQPAARKGGTIKKGKKGRGYVDVMAK